MISQKDNNKDINGNEILTNMTLEDKAEISRYVKEEAQKAIAEVMESHRSLSLHESKKILSNNGFFTIRKALSSGTPEGTLNIRKMKKSLVRKRPKMSSFRPVYERPAYNFISETKVPRPKTASMSLELRQIDNQKCNVLKRSCDRAEIISRSAQHFLIKSEELLDKDTKGTSSSDNDTEERSASKINKNLSRLSYDQSLQNEKISHIPLSEVDIHDKNTVLKSPRITQSCKEMTKNHRHCRIDGTPLVQGDTDIIWSNLVGSLKNYRQNDDFLQPHAMMTTHEWENKLARSILSLYANKITKEMVAHNENSLPKTSANAPVKSMKATTDLNNAESQNVVDCASNFCGQTDLFLHKCHSSPCMTLGPKLKSYSRPATATSKIVEPPPVPQLIWFRGAYLSKKDWNALLCKYRDGFYNICYGELIFSSLIGTTVFVDPAKRQLLKTMLFGRIDKENYLEAVSIINDCILMKKFDDAESTEDAWKMLIFCCLELCVKSIEKRKLTKAMSK